ncbi:LuxR C-terminal-related transcriptional regulator [Mariniflexile sp. AS56]|uniref:LuxR C-terminal-related transcriptional regulator n=1 Tax=Mariniflexile sp. AS56 TaxID=3063957 RepID=UPI0026EBD769|nr:LuxR C-terminal-related transcriptional regulator [Mariniflexile sp. AS56]MDO7173442.1 LuxR C-terminal-related transcriptional regulator [Mariniflexile sp. AS56]
MINLSSSLTQDFHGLSNIKKQFNTLKKTPFVTNKQCLYVLDWNQSQIVFTLGVTSMLGYSKDEFNMDVVLNKIHPEDKLLVNRIIKTSVDFINKTTIKKGSHFLTKSFRIQKKDGSFLKVLSQIAPFQTDENGDLVSYWTMLTDISFMNTNDTVEWDVFLDEFNITHFKEKIYCEHLDLFTKREIEIISLIKKELTTKQIALKIHLSPHTVISHRKNIFKKSNCHDVKGLLIFCENNGVF